MSSRPGNYQANWHYSVIHNCRSQWPRGLRRGSAAAHLLGLWVRIPLGDGCLSFVSDVFCQVDVSASGWSLFQRSPTECDLSECRRAVWRIRIPLGVDICLLWVMCVVSRGLCVGLITLPEESYRVWCVWVPSCSLDKEEALAEQELLRRRRSRGGGGYANMSFYFPCK
jgi:hypothetical protein